MLSNLADRLVVTVQQQRPTVQRQGDGGPVGLRRTAQHVSLWQGPERPLDVHAPDLSVRVFEGSRGTPHDESPNQLPIDA